jgi:hypothetical protein
MIMKLFIKKIGKIKIVYSSYFVDGSAKKKESYLIGINFLRIYKFKI